MARRRSPPESGPRRSGPRSPELLLRQRLLGHEVEYLRLLPGGFDRGHLPHERLSRRRRREDDQLSRPNSPNSLTALSCTGSSSGPLFAARCRGCPNRGCRPQNVDAHGGPSSFSGRRLATPGAFGLSAPRLGRSAALRLRRGVLRLRRNHTGGGEQPHPKVLQQTGMGGQVIPGGVPSVPSRSPPWAIQAPLFSRIPASTPRSITSPSPDALPVSEVELHLAEGRGQLVLDDLDPSAVPHDAVAVLERSTRRMSSRTQA